MRPRLYSITYSLVILAAGVTACDAGTEALTGQTEETAAVEPVAQQESADTATPQRAPARTVTGTVEETTVAANPGTTPPQPASPTAQVTPAPAIDDVSKGLDNTALIFSPEPDVDFGEMLQGEKRDHTFVIGNKGDEDLTIRSVNPTCGCTIAEVKTPDGRLLDPRKHTPNTDMMVLKPGETSDISVEFNSRGQPTRKLQKHIMVISSDNKQPAYRLTMNVTITQGVQIDPNPLQFGEVVRGQKKTARAWIKLKQMRDIEITGWKEKPEYFEVTHEKGTAPDGTPAIAIDVTLLPTAPIGYIAPALTCTTNNKRLSQIQIQLYAHVKSEVVFDTGNKINKERIDFEVIPFGESRTRSLDILNGNPELPYIVESVELESKHSDMIDVSLEPLEPGKHYKVTLTTSASLDARFFRGILKVKSTHTDLAEKQIHFHGWIKKAKG